MQLTKLGSLLEAMNREGGFSLSLLIDREGLVIAGASSNGHDSEGQAAAVALIQGAVDQSRTLGLGPVDELTLRSVDGERFVVRRIGSGADRMHMGVIVPKGRYYRRITNRALRELNLVLADLRGDI